MTTLPGQLTYRPADMRGRTELGWLHSRHSFSFGQYRDPANMGYRSLRVLNDDIVEPAQGFGEHGHDNMEIITWVLRGSLKHGDSLGNMRTLSHGEVQVMTAGTGIQHSEFNASAADPVHFLQMWITPARRGVEPRYLQEAFDRVGRANRWQTLASGRGTPGALPIEQDAELHVTALEAGQSLAVPVAQDRHAYIHVALGHARINDQPMSPGDAITASGPSGLTLRAIDEAQVLWFDLA